MILQHLGWWSECDDNPKYFVPPKKDGGRKKKQQHQRQQQQQQQHQQPTSSNNAIDLTNTFSTRIAYTWQAEFRSVRIWNHPL